MTDSSNKLSVVLAVIDDLPGAHEIMKEAALRLISRGEEMWTMKNVAPEAILPRIERKELFIVKLDGISIGTIVFQSEDPIYWPEKPKGEAGYLHRIALRDGFTGRNLTAEIILWAKAHAIGLGLKYLRLDVQAFRKKLCALYERLGFYQVDEVQLVKDYRSSRFEMILNDQ